MLYGCVRTCRVCESLPVAYICSYFLPRSLTRDETVRATADQGMSPPSGSYCLMFSLFV